MRRAVCGALDTENPTTAADCVRSWCTGWDEVILRYVLVRWRQGCFVSVRWIDLRLILSTPSLGLRASDNIRRRRASTWFFARTFGTDRLSLPYTVL